MFTGPLKPGSTSTTLEHVSVAMAFSRRGLTYPLHIFPKLTVPKGEDKHLSKKSNVKQGPPPPKGKNWKLTSCESPAIVVLESLMLDRRLWYVISNQSCSWTLSQPPPVGCVQSQLWPSLAHNLGHALLSWERRCKCLHLQLLPP